MNIVLPGYQIISAIHEGVKTVVYRAVREADGKRAIVKALKAAYPTLEEIADLRHEYQILQPLNIEGIVNTYGLENYKNGLALILEDFEGDSLKALMSAQKIPMLSFLSLAIQIASTLAELHKNNIIHKDIKPHNILINSHTYVVKIIDFSIASRLSKENPIVSNPEELEGTLAYMSPEQTGRMNRSLDYRTDFYSLGVTFYELLTGGLPFISTEPLEIVHSHIAKIPVPPHQINPEIPEAISEIVMKLMAKTAEDRYQSALGLKADLEICFDRLLATEKIENFRAGELDKSGQFLIPQKLYGREIEVATLLEAFERVRSGAAEMMLVCGYSGIGKTCVVQEVHKPIVGARGYFIAGKFDQFKRNIPYAALIQAFQSLVRQLLTETDANIKIWKEKLLEAFGHNGQVIINVIPEVEKIVGSQPPVQPLGPTETQNRFNQVFQKFLKVFTQKQHPLVIFLDDLQWADSASLKVIELLMTEEDSQYLLLIGAYRDNEVSPTHATMGAIAKIEQAGAVVNNIVLQPLNFSHVNQLVADTVGENLTPLPPSLQGKGENNCSPPLAPGGLGERSTPLAELLFNKTGGNPFFLTQLLQTLHSEELLTFDFSQGKWQWDLKQIQAIGITDYNVVDLVAKNIQKLPRVTQEVLKLAACIGNQFNLDVLAIVNEKSQSDTAIALWEALHAGLVLPLSDAYKIPLVMGDRQSNPLPITQISYKFLHDRVQQAAYSLIPSDEKKATHLTIGELLLRHTPIAEREEKVFDIVNQLNIGVEFITHQSSKDGLAELNLIACRKAKAATAYEAAVRYVNVGLQLLPELSWKSHYDLTLNLYVEAVEAEYLSTNFQRANELSEVVLSKAKTLLEKVNVYEKKIQFYIAQNQMQAAIDTALPVLKLLGVSLPKKASIPSILMGLVRIKLTLRRKSIEELASLPVMTDPYKLATMRILMTVIAAAVLANPELFPLIAFTMIHLTIKYGNSPQSAFAYVVYGVILCTALGEIDSGYQFGQIALTLLEKLDAREFKGKVQLSFDGSIRHWKDPAIKTIKSLFEAIQISLEVGDIEFACYNALIYCNHIFLIGNHLEGVEQKHGQYREVMLKYKQEFNFISISILRQLILNLVGKSADVCQLIGESFNEHEMLPILKKSKKDTVLFYLYFAKLLLFYLFKDYAQSVAWGKLAEQQEKIQGYSMCFAVHRFYYSLALLALYNEANQTEPKQYIKKIISNQKKMKKWAESSPNNYQHKYELVEAEKARILGQDVKAIEYYDRAITGAKEHGYVQEEALANELAAEFYFSRGREKFAQTYLTEAYYGYIRWGAKAKVRDLETRYPHIFSELLKRETTDIDATRTKGSTTGGNSALLDLVTVMKASQAISSEIVIDKLLSNLMHILSENAGATKAFLFVEKEGKLVIAAESSLEKNKVLVLPSVPIEARPDLPGSIINYVARTQETVVLSNAAIEGFFTTDAYIARTKPKSILCLPLMHKGLFTGILYLENNLAVGTFTQQRCSVLKLLATQASISLENASIYNDLQESEARERLKAEQLEQSLHKLQQTQAQLVQTEKISSLGQLVAGVAHEVNNPVSFISGNIQYVSQYTSDLMNHLQLYQQHLANLPADIVEHAEEIDLEFVKDDLPKMLSSMKLGTERIKEIMQSLRNFSRVDTTEKKSADIHAGLDSTLMILQHRLKGKGEQKPIRLIKEYGDLPPVMCYSGQLNQVFMNLLANAIDALDEARLISEKEIIIRTDVGKGQKIMDNQEESSQSAMTDSPFVVIRIKDNGPGMTPEVCQKLFDPFFTTKPEGKGTGLGLSISYQIVVEKHGGHIECISAPGEGAEFVIEIPVKQQSCQTALPVRA